MLKNNKENHGENEYLKFLAREKDISDQIINNSRSMISIINRNYIYEKVNSTFCDAHKVVVDAVLGKSLGDVWGQQTFLESIKNNVDLCFSGKTIRYEASFSTPTMGQRFFEVVFRPLSISGSEITHLLVETFDINDLKRTRQAVIDKEEEFRKFETNLPIGFLRCDSSGRILHANQAFIDMVECVDENKLTSLNLGNLYTEEGLFGSQFDQLLASNSRTFGLVRMKTLNGNELACRISGFLATDSSCKPLFIDFAIEDSTRELMLENRLIQAQKLETIGALAGGIAHDFNNILATISGYSEMLQEELAASSDISEKIRRIQAAVARARSITNQILTFSRQVENEKIEVDVPEVLRETIGFVKSSVPSNIRLKTRISGKRAVVLADPTQLFRVFLNLMTNAMQSMEEDGGTLAVSVAVVDGKHISNEVSREIVAAEYVLISFRDSGRGMDPAVAERIFEPFFTTRSVGRGTGLGLSVVHGIVTEMEGEIVVSTARHKGSVFHIYLPVSHSVPEKRVRKKRRILFIKGDRHESKVFSSALEGSGYILLPVSGRKSLLEIFSGRTIHPDLVIWMGTSSDLKADELLEIVDQSGLNIPGILITDANRTPDEEKLLNSPLFGKHLVKPVSLREIREAIETLVKLHNKTSFGK